MNDDISPEIFARLVELAAFELAPEEAEYLRRQLNNQLKAVRELVAIPLDADMPVTSHGVAYTPATSPPLRSDEWQPYENPAGILEQAPVSEAGYFVVPDIPHKTLE